MIINAKQEQHADFRKPLSRSANERITDGHMLRLWIFKKITLCQMIFFDVAQWATIFL